MSAWEMSRGKRRRMLVAGLSLVATSTAFAAEVDASWLGGNGTWHLAGNWDIGTIPHNGVDTYNVLVDDPADTGWTVSVASNTLIDNLTIGATETIQIEDSRFLHLASGGLIDNAGVLELNSTGGGTYLRAAGGTVTLTGGGTVRFSNQVNNWIYRSGAGGLVNLDNTIEGAGHLGWAGAPMAIQNDGTVVANVTELLIVDGTGTFTNNGTLRADGGPLALNGGTFENANGVIEALDGSTVFIDATTVMGGTLQTTGSGEIRSSSAAARLNGTIDPVDNTGTYRVPDAQRLRGGGLWNNTGTVVIDSAGAGAYLQPEGTLTLTGGGTIRLSDQANNWIYRNGAGALVNLDNTIEGAGHLGWAGAPTAIQNDGVVVANVTEVLIVDGTGTFTNNGTLRADGGPLALSGGTFENANGVIEALDGSTVFIDATTVMGGALQTAGTGEIQSSSVAARLNGTINPIVNTGTLRVPNGLRLRGGGVWNNSGTVEVASSGGNTYLQPEGTLTLTGGGTIRLSDQASNWIYRNGVGNLVNVDNTISGSGNFGWSGAPMDILNQGTIEVDGTVGMTLNGGGVAGFVNEGAIIVTGAGGANLTGVFTNTTGTVIVDPNRLLFLTTDFVQTGGTTDVDGIVGGTRDILLQGGVLRGTGSVVDVINSGGTVAPGASAGTLTIAGNYSQQTGATLSIELGGFASGVDHDLLAITGTAALAGAIEIVPIGGFTTTIGDAFVVLDAASVTGGITTINATALPADQSVRVCTSPTQLEIRIVARTPGDADRDGDVDLTDLSTLLSQFGLTGPGLAGDVNDDGSVNLTDLSIVLANFGASVPCP